MYKRKDEGISPVIAIILIVGLIVILAAIVGPVALNTITEFAVQEKSTVGVTVKLLPEVGDSLTVDLINGKDINELSKYTLYAYYTNDTPMFETSETISDPTSKFTYINKDVDNVGLIHIIGTFADGHSELIFSSTLKDGAIDLSNRIVFITYMDESGTLYLQQPIFVNQRATYTPPAKSGYRFDGWYKELPASIDNRWDGTATESMTVYAHWEQSSSVVEFYLENLEGSYDHDRSIDKSLGEGDWNRDAVTTYITDNKLVPSGFEFESVSSDDNVTFKVKCKRLSYPITYEYASGSSTPDKYKTVPTDPYLHKYGQTVTPASFEEVDGYVFDGWYDDKECTRHWDNRMPPNALTLYGKWVALTPLTVAFSEGSSPHGSITSAKSFTTYENNLPLKLTEPTVSVNQGYSLGGWYRDSKYSGSAWDFERDTVKKSDFTDNTFTLYAKWDPVTYTIVYGNYGNTEAFYGDTANLPQKHTFGTNTYLPVASLKSGMNYLFDGWCYSDGTAADIISNTIMGDDEGKIYVYAKWSEFPLYDNQVWFHPNAESGDVSGSSVTVKFAGDSTAYPLSKVDSAKRYAQKYANSDSGTVKVTLGLSQFSEMDVYDGDVKQDKPYKFCGWAESEGSSTAAYADGSRVTVTFPNSKHLYAVWAKNYYTISLDPDKGKVSPSRIYVKKPDSGSASYPGSVPIPTRTGYSFKGWYNDSTRIYKSDGTFALSSRALSGDVTLKAKWEAKKYTITWKDWDGTVLETKEVSYGTMPEYSGATPARESTDEYSYTFTGWSPEVTTVKKAATYTAVYSSGKISYTIEWDTDGDGSSDDYTSVEYGDTPSHANGSKPSSAQYDYTFTGWSPSITKVTGTQKYTAQFSPTLRTHTITWKNYDGSVLKTEQVEYGTTPKYTGTSPTKPATAQYSYTFTGWSPEITSVTGPATYTAQFSDAGRTYTITWKNANNDPLEVDNNVAYGATPSYDGATPTMASTAQYSYTFTGWSPAITTVTGDKTYVAQYSETLRSYIVKFNSKGGNYTPASQTVEYGSYASEPTAPTRNGCTFSGWYNGNTKWDFGTNQIKGNVELTAHWSIKVTFYSQNKGEVPGVSSLPKVKNLALVQTPVGTDHYGGHDAWCGYYGSSIDTRNVSDFSNYKCEKYVEMGTTLSAAANGLNPGIYVSIPTTGNFGWDPKVYRTVHYTVGWCKTDSIVGKQNYDRTSDDYVINEPATFYAIYSYS